MKNFVKFDRHFFESDNQISCIGSGELGGKANGLVLIQDILNKKVVQEKLNGSFVSIPKMIVIRTNVFDTFMRLNDLYDMIGLPDDRIALAFQNANLPFEILGDLRTIVSNVKQPLAVRSSGVLEDDMFEPFAGIYGTKMTPNNQHDIDTRFKKLTEAIKFVYASTYFKAAREYMFATGHSTEEEKMAVIIQEVVGTRHNDRFYPEISGVACSYNFYPFGNAKPDDGVVNLALGLGKTIVDGGAAWSYSPSFPDSGPPFNSIGDMLKNTQTRFWAVNMGKPPGYDPVKETEFMIKGDIAEAETDGTLRYLVSTYDVESDRVWPGQSGKGPRILTFAPVLTMEYIPLNRLIKQLLEICEEELRSPVEIEFAVTIYGNKKSKPTFRFGFLQVRPMVVSTEDIEITDEEFAREDVFIASNSVLGNGIIHSINDIVFVDPVDLNAVSAAQTVQELDNLNRRLVEQQRPYILIGYGRWGTSDHSAGIPVRWEQISGARVIVEAVKDEMYTEMSQGSHFFHNVTSFKVFYFSLSSSDSKAIDREWLFKQKMLEERGFVKYVRTEKALKVKVDGKTGKGVIINS